MAEVEAVIWVIVDKFIDYLREHLDIRKKAVIIATNADISLPYSERNFKKFSDIGVVAFTKFVAFSIIIQLKVTIPVLKYRACT